LILRLHFKAGSLKTRGNLSRRNPSRGRNRVPRERESPKLIFSGVLGKKIRGRLANYCEFSTQFQRKVQSTATLSPFLLFAFHCFSSSSRQTHRDPPPSLIRCSFPVQIFSSSSSFSFRGASAIPGTRDASAFLQSRDPYPLPLPPRLLDIKRNRCRDGNLERHSGGYYIRRIWSDMNFPREFSARTYRAPGAPSRAPTRPITCAHNVGGMPGVQTRPAEYRACTRRSRTGGSTCNTGNT